MEIELEVEGVQIDPQEIGFLGALDKVSGLLSYPSKEVWIEPCEVGSLEALDEASEL